MQFKILGRTGISVSALCAGTLAFGGDADEAESLTMYGAYRDAGINFFDSADIYAGGRSEAVLGGLVAHERDELIIASKCGFPTGGDASAQGSGRQHLTRQVEASLKRLGLQGKPVWLTETGSTASPGLRLRTDYPNGPPSQAADVFRRTLPAWAAGDSLVLWHAHISSPERPGNRWQLYGLRRGDGTMLPSWYSFKLLTKEVTPFAAVTSMAGMGREQHGYRVQRRDGGLRWVFWGRGEVRPPSGAGHYTSVAPSQGGHQWTPVGGSLRLSAEPILVR